MLVMPRMKPTFMSVSAYPGTPSVIFGASSPDREVSWSASNSDSERSSFMSQANSGFTETEEKEDSSQSQSERSGNFEPLAESETASNIRSFDYSYDHHLEDAESKNASANNNLRVDIKIPMDINGNVNMNNQQIQLQNRPRRRSSHSHISMDLGMDIEQFRHPERFVNKTDVPLVVILCGLPARGKSYLSRKLCSFLRWRGYSVKTFNAGDYRRKTDGAGQDANYYSSQNKAAMYERERLARLAFQDLMTFIDAGGDIAVFDATNTTVERRKFLINLCQEHGLNEPMFIESICTDKALLEKNYRLKLRNEDYKNMDQNVALEDFKRRVKMYEDRYEPVGDTEEEDNMCYLKVYNVGKKIVVNNCNGWLKSQVITILQNFHVVPRRIYLTRCGESEDFVHGIIGRDSKLTANGKAFALRLRDFIEQRRSTLPIVDYNVRGVKSTTGDAAFDQAISVSAVDETQTFGVMELPEDQKRPFVLFSSVLRRGLETIQPTVEKYRISRNENIDALNQLAQRYRKESEFDLEGDEKKNECNSIEDDKSFMDMISFSPRSRCLSSNFLGREGSEDAHFICTSALNEINAGLFEGLTYEDIRQKFPEEYMERQKRKVTYRYPGGESYLDVVQRLHPIVLELERQKIDTVVVGHTATIRALLAYFQGKTLDQVAYEDIPLHAVFEVQPDAYGCHVVQYDL